MMVQSSPAGGQSGRPVWSSSPQTFRGVAQVPEGHRPAFTDTADVPVVEEFPVGRPSRQTYGRGAPPRGLIVRRRGRRLRAGAAWSWTGLTIVSVCWGIWAISVRGTELLGPVIGLGLVLATGLLLFVVARLLGRAVFERTLGRERLSAWPSHLTVCVFWTLAGLTFLQQTWWVVQSGRLLGDSWQWLTNLWPL